MEETYEEWLNDMKGMPKLKESKKELKLGDRIYEVFLFVNEVEPRGKTLTWCGKCGMTIMRTQNMKELEQLIPNASELISKLEKGEVNDEEDIIED